MGTQTLTDSFSDDDLFAASVLLDLSCVRVPFSQLRWGSRRPRNEPAYQFKLEPEPAGPASDLEEKKRKKKKKEETASPDTPLSFPTSGGEEPLVIPPPKQVKKATNHKEVGFRVFNSSGFVISWRIVSI